MINIDRHYNLALPPGQSAFLWGARQTGKSTFLKSHYPNSLYIDLLKSDVFLRYSKEPYLLREEILALDKESLSNPIIIDEVQKIPLLLDEIHWLIENTQASFILCGSSARKLKRGAANLLGGRAWRFEFYPLTFVEIKNIDLLKALNNGLLPSHYLADSAKRALRAYVSDYLTEEIQAESLVRNLPNFARFLDSMAFSNGEMTNYSNIARDCGVDSKTVKQYYQILVDTLLGYYVLPFKRKVGRDLINATPKFYLFDVGVANYLSGNQLTALKGSAAGKAFEHYIFMELMAYKGIHEKRFEINYWRTKTNLEVDFVLDHGNVAIEVKISSQVQKSDLNGLITFCKDYRPEKAYVVSQDPKKRLLQVDDDIEITIINWREFLQELWLENLL